MLQTISLLDSYRLLCLALQRPSPGSGEILGILTLSGHTTHVRAHRSQPRHLAVTFWDLKFQAHHPDEVTTFSPLKVVAGENLRVYAVRALGAFKEAGL